MTNIDKILEEVERREVNRPHGYLDRIPTEEEFQAAALAAEVRGLRAKLVAAASDIARLWLLEFGVEPSKCIALAEKEYGIRLKFEGGKFMEDTAK